MKKILLPLAVTVALTGNAHADGLGAEVGVMTLHDSGINLGAAYTYVGYDFDHSELYTSTPEVFLGVGVVDDGVFEAKEMYGINYKGSFHLSESWDVFYRLGYNHMAVEASGFWGSVSESESAPGLGGGFAWRGLNVSYMHHFKDIDIDALSIGWHF